MSVGAEERFVDIAPDEVEAWRRRGAMIVDVRESWEFRMGHVPGARTIPLGQLVRRLREVANLAGGTQAWRERGLSVARP
jgi:rhodanese-related sulfurtransferase